MQKPWGESIPPTLFSILGRIDLYPVYMESLTNLFEQVVQTGKLPYPEARDCIERVLTAYGIGELPYDNEFDDAMDGDLKISSPGIVLRRLEKAGWLRRETDRLTGDDVLRIPEQAFKLLRTFLEIGESREVEIDIRLLSILKMLQQDNVSPRRAIAFAHQEMVGLVDAIQGLNQQYALLHPDLDKVDHGDLADWTEAFNHSQVKVSYDNLRVRNSPDRWYSEIIEVVRDLQHRTQEIAEESLRENGTRSFEAPNPAQVRTLAARISAQLTFIEQGMGKLIEATEELDQRAVNFASAYTRRVHTALASQTSEKLMMAADNLFASLRALPHGRGGGDVQLAEGFSLGGHFQIVTAQSVNIRRMSSESSGQVEERLAAPPPLELDEQTVATLRRVARHIGPRAVREHFLRIFGKKQEMSVNELLGETIESAMYLVRLIDCCSMNDFAFEIVWPAVEDEFFETLPICQNDYRWITDLNIRRHAYQQEE